MTRADLDRAYRRWVAAGRPGLASTKPRPRKACLTCNRRFLAGTPRRHCPKCGGELVSITVPG